MQCNVVELWIFVALNGSEIKKKIYTSQHFLFCVEAQKQEEEKQLSEIAKSIVREGQK